MSRWKSSFLISLAAGLLLAQNAPQRQSVDVMRPGARLACKCGVCSGTLATCPMLECEFGKPAKEKIFKMLQAGMSDSAIVDQFVKDYGADIFRASPSPVGRLVPYLAIIPGLLLIWWFMRRYYRKRPAAALPETPALSRYNEQIEKELANLD